MARPKGTKVENAGEWKPAFLAFMARYPNVMRAARHVGVARALVYRERQNDAAFKVAFDEALAEGIDTIEGLAMELAAKSRDPKNNTLRMFMLKSHKPEIYKETVRNEMSGPDGKAITIKVVYEDTQTDDSNGDN